MSSQTSAPSKLPIVTSNMLLWFFLVQAVSLSNKSDFRQCIIMSMSLSLIVVNFLANEIASERRDSVMDESKLSMSNEANECFCMSGMLVNQLITSDVIFHWLSFVIFLIFELILSRICLLTFPSSLFAEFMRRHVGWLAKLSLWSFRVIKTCCFAICSVRLSMLSSWAIDFACESMMLAASVLAFL